jgi:hypothetical protein
MNKSCGSRSVSAILLNRNRYRYGNEVPVYSRDAPDTGTVLPDIWPAGYPANPKAGYRISGHISGMGRIPDIWPDTWLDNYIFGQISNKFIKKALTIIGFCKH